MKKQIGKQLCGIVLTATLLILAANYFLQVKNARESMVQSSQVKINQIQEILKNNSQDLVQLEESLMEDYIIRAKAAAYILQNRPEIVGDLKEMKKVASLLQVDELHVFDRSGTLYAGSEPEYFGYSFDSGEQMRFFKPMLEDNGLELVQDIEPNTAEGKLMQYTAVWQENGENIVQIGMEPVRFLNAMKKNDLSYIFSMVTPEAGTILYVADKESGQIIGSTHQEFVGDVLEEAGIALPEAVSSETGFEVRVNGVKGYACFAEYEGQYIGVAQKNSILYRNIGESMLLVGLYVGAISLIMIAVILKQIDRSVIQGIDELTENLTEITGGNLDLEVHVDTSPEFARLSHHINQMVEGLLSGTDKLSRIFEITDVQAGVYEYNDGMKRVRATKKLGTLLMMTPRETAWYLEDKTRFEKKIHQICTSEVEGYRDVYQLSQGTECYLRIQAFSEKGHSMGIITDVTEEILIHKQLEHDRDYDLLTMILNRRGFYRHMDVLFREKESLGNAVMLMMDMDGLKYMNDHYGHASGDQAIQTAAGILKRCPAPNKIMARLSGDEFALFLYGETREELQAYIEELHERMLETSVTFYEDTELPVRLSGGYLFYPEYDVSYVKMLSLADQAMYEAKRERKSEFRLYCPKRQQAGEGGSCPPVSETI